MLHQKVHVRTGMFGYRLPTLQLALIGIDKVTGEEGLFICEGTIRDSLHMAQMIRRTGHQVPHSAWE